LLRELDQGVKMDINVKGEIKKVTFESDLRGKCPKCGKNGMESFVSSGSQLVVEGIDEGKRKTYNGKSCLLCGYDEYTGGVKPPNNVPLEFSGKILEEMDDLRNVIFKEAANFYVGRNLAAGTRLRVALMKIIKIANMIRKEVKDAKVKIKAAR
jgi:predicted nucleic-acid-binding Zn-ribbon protein